MTMPVLRGLLVVVFFALCAFYLVPVFVPRPAFIPGFAPPPDMWPKTVSLIGIVLGLLALTLAVRGGEGGSGRNGWQFDQTYAAPVCWSGCRFRAVSLCVALCRISDRNYFADPFHGPHDW